MTGMVNCLREVRTAHSVVVWELVTLSGVSPATITAIEKYGYLPKLETRTRLANALKVPVEAIWPELEAERQGETNAIAR